MKNKSKEEAQKKLEQFSKLANKDGLHELDWERFFDFMIVVFDGNVDISVEDVESYLKEKGWREDKVIEIALKFEWGLDLLKYYKKKNIATKVITSKTKEKK